MRYSLRVHLILGREGAPTGMECCFGYEHSGYK